MPNKSNRKNRPRSVNGIINKIRDLAEVGDYIYRGERKDYEKVSSALYREYEDIDIESFNLRRVQREMLMDAKKHIGEPPQALFDDSNVKSNWASLIRNSEQRPIINPNELEILTELQHYGGITNLIDFTTDYLIAIFFACAGAPTKDGRIILLEKTELIERTMIVRPQNPKHRVVAQKSVFLYPPDGVIDIPDDNIVYIPAYLKQRLLEFLRRYHDISAETIYNDIHGFIINQNIHQKASKEFYLGLTFQIRGFNAETLVNKQEEYRKAITHYDLAIKLNSEIRVAYHNRGECWLHLEEWEKAYKDLTIAQDMGLNIVQGFHNDYKGGFEVFKEKTGIELPKFIRVLLGG